ncbi:uncharacterized protein [Henckelia pumila]|uniref:uncharacterized protein n=1 Tax=Henckelia pumila TaxID=405737 RepID=UPI003C6E6A03
MVDNRTVCDIIRPPVEDPKKEKKARVLEVDALTALNAKIDALTHHMAVMQTASANQVQVQQPEEQQVFEVDATNFMGNQGRQPYNPYSNTYNTGWKNHTNFLWKAADPTSNTSKPVEKKPSFEEIMMKYVAGTETRLQNQEAMLQKLEIQMGQIATQLSNRPTGTLPSNTETNPKGVNAIMVVTRAQSKKSEQMVEEKNVEGTKISKAKEDVRTKKFSMAGEKDALAQMPNYAKFLKDLLKNKKKLNDVTKVTMNEKIEYKLNLMSHALDKKLGICNIEPEKISLIFADGSSKYPRGMVENVLVKIDKFIYPIDFVILDMNADCEVPRILGHSFLSMSRALVDVEKGELILRLNNEQVMFNMLKLANDSPQLKSCSDFKFIDVFHAIGDECQKIQISA